MSPKFYVTMFAILLLLTVACHSLNVPTAQPSQTPVEETSLQFETIELRQPVTHEKTWSDPAPDLVVIATSAGIEVARKYVSDEATTILEQLDFSQYIALIAFDGWKSEGYQDFQIQRIVRQGDQVLVFAQPSQKLGTLATGVITSLYHLVKIPKNTTWDRAIIFKLYFDRTQTSVATVKQYIP